jgi:hypothetical protein
MQAFIERVAMMVAYPYIRAAIADTATRLSLRRPVLGLLRANEVESFRGDEDTEDESPVN